MMELSYIHDVVELYHRGFEAQKGGYSKEEWYSFRSPYLKTSVVEKILKTISNENGITESNQP